MGWHLTVAPRKNLMITQNSNNPAVTPAADPAATPAVQPAIVQPVKDAAPRVEVATKK